MNFNGRIGAGLKPAPTKMFSCIRRRGDRPVAARSFRDLQSCKDNPK